MFNPIYAQLVREFYKFDALKRVMFIKYISRFFNKKLFFFSIPYKKADWKFA